MRAKESAREREREIQHNHEGRDEGACKINSGVWEKKGQRRVGGRVTQVTYSPVDSIS